MITATEQPLPMEAETQLRQWMQAPGAATLLKVIESNLKQAQTEALRAAVKSDVSNQMLEASNIGLQHAQRFQTFIEIWEWCSNPETKLYTVKLT